MAFDELATKHIPHLPEEISWCRYRPERHRTPIPKPQGRVLYRRQDWDTPVHATVLEVHHHDPDGRHIDWNCWRVRTNPDTALPVYDGDNEVVIDPHPDAWPSLLLRVDGQASHVVTREARLRGSAGWLPLDWQKRYRPAPGREAE